MHVTVNCPSYKRAGGLLTPALIPWARVWVCETEIDEYREQNPRVEFVPIPAGVQGNVSRVRNHILDDCFGRGEEAVCILDDDVTRIRRWEGRIPVDLTEGDFDEWLTKYTTVCKEWGYRFWGLNLNPDKQAYREYSPFSTLSYIGAAFGVHLPHDCRYDPELSLKEDYDMSLQQIHAYRGQLRLNAYHLEAKAGMTTGNFKSGQTGGCATYRTMDREKEQFERLIRKWGTNVVRRDTKHAGTAGRSWYDHNPKLRVPLKGI